MARRSELPGFGNMLGVAALDKMIEEANQMANMDFNAAANMNSHAVDDAEVEESLARMEAEERAGSHVSLGPIQAAAGPHAADAILDAMMAEEIAVSGAGAASVRAGHPVSHSPEVGPPPARRPRLDDSANAHHGAATIVHLAPEAEPLIHALQTNITAFMGKAKECQQSGDVAKARIYATLATQYTADIDALRRGAAVAQITGLKNTQFDQAKAQLGALKNAAAGAAHGSRAPVVTVASAAAPAPLNTPARQDAYSQLHAALLAHMRGRYAEAQALNARVAQAGAGAPEGERRRLEAAIKPIAAEVKEYKEMLKNVEGYLSHPSCPPCPSWTYKVSTELQETIDDSVPAGALALSVLRIVHLKDKHGRPEKGEVSVSFRLPAPQGVMPQVGTTGTKKIDGDGTTEVGYDAMLSISSGPRDIKPLQRVFVSKFLTVAVERTSGGLLGMFPRTEVIARGALPLSTLVDETSISTTVALRPPEADVSEDGVRMAGGIVPTAPGAEGERGGIFLSLRVHAPVKAQKVGQVVERKVPIVTAWPTINPTAVSTSSFSPIISSISAFPGSANVPAPALPTTGSHNGPAAGVPAGGAVASSANELASVSAAAISHLAAAAAQGNGIDIESKRFRADANEFLVASQTLLQAFLTTANSDIEAKDREFRAAKRAVEKQFAATTDTDSKQKAIDVAVFPLIAGIAASKKAYDDMYEAWSRTQAAIESGEMTMLKYQVQVEAAVARDEALEAALAKAGRSTEGAVVKQRLVSLREECRAISQALANAPT